MSAASKVNLLLAVTGRRPDGYHELDTVFFPLKRPADELSLEFRADKPGSIEIRVDAPGVPSDPARNLCGKAATAYFRKAALPSPPGVEIRLRKCIPVAAGMGGGSSDAAAVLLLLQERFQALDEDALKEVALSLGADVPFFLHPEPARARGVGERLERIQGAPETLPLLIAAPSFPVSAAWAYRHMDLSKAVATPPNAERLIRALTAGDLPALADCMRNDLEDALFAKFPLLSRMRAELDGLGALKTMISGSGPTLFSLFPNRDALACALRQAEDRFDPAVRFFATF